MRSSRYDVNEAIEQRLAQLTGRELLYNRLFSCYLQQDLEPPKQLLAQFEELAGQLDTLEDRIGAEFLMQNNRRTGVH